MRSAAVIKLLSNRNYAIYTAGNSVSLIGTWIQSIAFGWLAWEMTGSAFWLGLIAASGLIPTLAGGLVGGILADRVDRLRLTALTQVLSFLVTFGLFLSYRFGVLTLGLLVLFKVAVSALAAFSQPARMALIPSLVGRDMLVPAVSFGSLIFNTARFVGPAIAGLIIALGDLGWAFLINSLSFLWMAIAIMALRIDRIEFAAAADGKPKRAWRDLAAGASYVGVHPGTRALFLLLVTVVVFVRPISDFFPVMATEVYGRGIEAVATLTSAMALGSIGGAVYAVGRRLRGLTASGLIACAVYAVFIIGFLNVWTLWLGCVILAAAGFCSVLFATAAQTLIQVSVEESMRGRVLSLWFIVSRGGPDLGALVMGAAAELAGVRYAFAAGAALCLAMSLWALSRNSVLARSLELPKPLSPKG